MKRLFTILFFFSTLQANAQKIASKDMKTLKQVEDSLQTYSSDMISAAEASARFNADSAFIKTLVRALKTPYSFSYPFDSIKTV
jgi:hypothetical protein